MSVELLCHFSHHNDYFYFRIEELEALSEFYHWPKENLWTAEPRPDSQSDTVLVKVVLPSIEIAQRIASKSILIRRFLEIWVLGTTVDDCVEKMMHFPHDKRRKHASSEVSFCFQVETYGIHISQKEKVERMNKFEPAFDKDSKIDCKNPDTILYLIEEWGHVIRGEAPRKTVLGRVIANARPDKGVPWWHKYNLPQRPVLGPTSLSHELAFLMCNQGHVRPGSVVMDPYYGTGSILVSASHLGAFPVGSEVDMRVLQGWGIAYLNKRVKHKPGQKTNYTANFKHYGLPPSDVIRADNAAWPWKIPLTTDEETNIQQVEVDGVNLRSHRLFVRGMESIRPWVDAILSDPPYGIRAATRQGGQKQSNKKRVFNEDGDEFGGEGQWRKERLARRERELQRKADSIEVDEETFKLEQMAADRARAARLAEAQATALDLMDLASRVLVDNGRLVFLLPVDLELEKGVESESFARKSVELKKEELELISMSLESLAAGMGRYLITMRRLPRDKTVSNE